MALNSSKVHNDLKRNYFNKQGRLILRVIACNCMNRLFLIGRFFFFFFGYQTGKHIAFTLMIDHKLAYKDMSQFHSGGKFRNHFCPSA